MTEASEEEIMAIPHTQCTLSGDALNALLLNEQTNTLIFARREALDEELKIIEIPFNKIYEVAIMEDEVFTVRTKNHLMSGSLLAEADEVEEEEVEEDTISQLSLKLVVDRLSEPIQEYMFMDNSEEPISKRKMTIKKPWSFVRNGFKR